MLIVRPAFVLDSIRSEKILDATAYEPSAAAAAAAAAESESDAAPRGAAPPLAEVGLSSGQLIEVCVEMSDEPRLQWWPARVEEGRSAPGEAGQGVHPLVYLPLPSRGYADESPSRARFERARAEQRRRLWDAEEAIWRPWRRALEVDAAVDAPAVAAPAAAASPVPAAAAAPPQASNERRGSWVGSLLARRGASRTRSAVLISGARRERGRPFPSPYRSVRDVLREI